MKQLVLGSFIGIFLLRMRDIYEIVVAALIKPEAVGTIANDQMATALVTKLCSTNKTFIDVGAHIGSVIAAVMNNDSAINIIAIEAMPDKANKLRSKYTNATILECAVGEVEDVVTFYVNNIQTGYSSLIKPATVNSSITEISVPVKRIDEIIQRDDIDVIKIDVEGAELGVLRGATNLFSCNRPIVMFESAPYADNDAGYTKEDIYDWFVGNDYEVFIPIRVAHDSPSLSKLGFIESHSYPRRTTNYFAIPKERRLEVRDRARKVLHISRRTLL